MSENQDNQKSCENELILPPTPSENDINKISNEEFKDYKHESPKKQSELKSTKVDLDTLTIVQRLESSIGPLLELNEKLSQVNSIKEKLIAELSQEKSDLLEKVEALLKENDKLVEANEKSAENLAKESEALEHCKAKIDVLLEANEKLTEKCNSLSEKIEKLEDEKEKAKEKEKH